MQNTHKCDHIYVHNQLHIQFSFIVFREEDIAVRVIDVYWDIYFNNWWIWKYWDLFTKCKSTEYMNLKKPYRQVKKRIKTNWSLPADIHGCDKFFYKEIQE